jgi:hypothetical protein
MSVIFSEFPIAVTSLEDAPWKYSLTQRTVDPTNPIPATMITAVFPADTPTVNPIRRMNVKVVIKLDRLLQCLTEGCGGISVGSDTGAGLT